MSKKNKIIYSDIQPNAKEAGIWVNTTDGNVKVEKDGKWVDDGGSNSGGGDRILIYSFKTYVLGKVYIADYFYNYGEYGWWFGEYDSDVSLTHDEYKQAIIDAAKQVESTDYLYAYGYVDKVTQTGKVTLGYALVNGASTSKLKSWSQQAIGGAIICSNVDFIITTDGDKTVKNEVHIKHKYRQIYGFCEEGINANYALALYYPHVKGTECKIYDKNMKLLLTIENSSCTYPINDPYLNEQKIVIEN